MHRIVTAEALDGLAETDPSAMRSRRDLRRVHVAMRSRTILLEGLRRLAVTQQGGVPLRVLELGAGDGSLMLGVARTLAPAWPRVDLTLLDRQRLVDAATVERYAQLGWIARPVVADAHAWAVGTPDGPWDLVIANLFLHHFEGDRLAALLGAVAARSQRFFACEPRRAWLALAGSRLVGAIGANPVTRADAVLSVHAGFRDREITAAWPADAATWNAREYRAGLFSHCFAAQRTRVHR